MLTHISVDGFRSLCNFTMEIRPGLNILIGPNGGGKSNIISFFQFLSRLVNSNLSEALSLTGGAGAFFEKIGPAVFRSQVKATVNGLMRLVGMPNTLNERKGWQQYRYSFSIEASEKFDKIIFCSQELHVKHILIEGDTIPEVSWNEDQGYWDVILDADASRINVRKIASNWATKQPGTLSLSQLQQVFNQEANAFSPASYALVGIPARYIQGVGQISADLVGGETLNINPAKVKEPEDTAREPGIRSDGSGLAATLWHMSTEHPHPPYAMWYWPSRSNLFFPRQQIPRAVFNQLQSLMQLVNTQIKEIRVNPEPFDNLFRITVSLTGREGEVELPLAAMSDGTIKWASLITAILTYHSIFAIEEPENFLHPLMLKEIVKLMRTTTADKFSFVIMTTHSETLLNAAKPEEVIIVAINNGITSGRRPSDPKFLENEIRETGFGLGHYYLAGDLSDA